MPDLWCVDCGVEMVKAEVEKTVNALAYLPTYGEDCSICVACIEARIKNGEEI